MDHAAQPTWRDRLELTWRSFRALVREVRSKSKVQQPAAKSVETGIEIMEERVEDVAAIASDVYTAFEKLSLENPTVVIRFREAFDERAHTPGLYESKRGSDGLAEALGGLLGRIPPASSSEVEFGLIEGTTLDEPFKKELEIALSRVAERYPLALSLLKRHQIEDGRPLSLILQDLLSHYSQNRAVVPY